METENAINRAYEISTRVNDPGNDDPRVVEPLDHEQSGLGEFGSG